MEIGIRPFIETDLDPVLEITDLAWAPWFESFRAMFGESIFGVVYPNHQQEQRRGIEAACRGEHAQTCWIAQTDDIVVGFIVYAMDSASLVGQINYLAVHPNYQQRGAGRRLTDFAICKFREAGMKVANVGTGGDPSHAAARQVYEAAGFRSLPLVNYYREL